MKVELINYTLNPIESIEKAASTCYDSDSNYNGKIFNHCYKSGHHSVLEFADFTFRVNGISRACSHQLVRHRLASYAQRSQRYCVEDGFEFVTPSSIEANKNATEVYGNTIQVIKQAYTILIGLGIKAEDARMLLPNACCTEICIKMNLRELVHFCNERLCASAQWEIRQMAKLMREAVIAVEPRLSDILVPKCEVHKPYSFCTENKNRSCGKHPVVSELITQEGEK